MVNNVVAESGATTLSKSGNNYSRGTISDAPLELLSILSDLSETAASQLSEAKTSFTHAELLSKVDKRTFQYLVRELSARVTDTSISTLRRLIVEYHQVLMARNRDKGTMAAVDERQSEEYLRRVEEERSQTEDKIEMLTRRLDKEERRARQAKEES